MQNVYEITITKEVMKTETFTELVNFGDVSNQQKEDLIRSLKTKFGDGEEGVNVNIVTTPTEKEPEKYYGGVDEYAPAHLCSKPWVKMKFDKISTEPSLQREISFPQNTKSVLAYNAGGHRRTTLLPNHSLLFYFSIEKEKVVDLWEKGEIKELQKFNIIPKEITQTNLFHRDNRNPGVVVHPNHSVFIKEIYKKMKGVNPQRIKQGIDIQFLAIFTCDEWRKTTVETVGDSFCTHRKKDNFCDSIVSLFGVDSKTNEIIASQEYEDEDGNMMQRRIGTFAPTIDEKGNLCPYRKGDNWIINYDN